MPANSVIQFRRGTAAQWTSVNPVLANGEPGYETDTGKEKRGDGTTTWASLAYIGSGAYTPLPTSTQNPLTGMYHVDGFGAIGDGTSHPLSQRYGTLGAAQAVYSFVTALTQTIDWAAWQAACAAVPSTGGMVYGSGKRYVNSHTVYVKSGTTVQGGGKLATKVTKLSGSFVAASTNNANLTGSAFACGPSYGTAYTSGSRGNIVTFRDLGIDGNKAGQTYTGITNFNYCSERGIGIRQVDQVEVSGCRIENTGQDGIFYSECGQIKTHHNDIVNPGSSDAAFTGIGKNGISHGGGNTSTYATALNCTDNYIIGAQDEGIQYGWARDIIISRNHIYNSGLKGIEGDHSATGTVNSPGNAIVTDNFIRTAGDEGIGITNADNQKIVISGNQIFGTTLHGINLSQADESTFLVTGNIIEGVAGGYAGTSGNYHGISVQGHKVTVADNKIYDCSGHGVSVISTTTLKVADNTFRNVLRSPVNINMTGDADILSITGNTVNTCDSHACIIQCAGTILIVSIVGNSGYNIGNAAASAGSATAFWITGASTVVRSLSIVGNTFTDRRSPTILGFGIDLTGCSTVTQMSYGQNIFRPSNSTGIGSRTKVSTSVLDGGGNMQDSGLGVRTATGSGTVQVWDAIVLSNGTSLTQTLMAANQTAAGRVYTIRNIHASSSCTVSTGGGNIDGSASATLAAGAIGRYVSDGTNWWSV